MSDVITNDDRKCARALEVLSGVNDPEIGLNVVDLGLLYQIDFDEQDVFVRMTLTTQFCPMGESITHEVTESLRTAFPGLRVHLELAFDPPWTPERISESGMEFLNS